MKRFRNYKIISLLSALVFFGEVRFANAADGLISDAWDYWIGNSMWESFQMWLGGLLLWVPSQILRLVGMLFNYVMEYTIEFSALLKETQLVNIGWEIFRDMSNMVFIFILLTTAIAIILGNQSYGAKTLLVKVILVALFINFSLFTTKVIIDSANVFTVGFYNAILKGQGDAGLEAANFNKGVSSVFVRSLNLQTIFKGNKEFNKKAITVNGSTLNSKNILSVALLGAVVLIVTSFVFLAASILLLKRLVVLMFLMMFSPLAFLGMILPATSSYSKQWWNTLFKEAFYAPVLMMFLYVVARAISSKEFRKVFVEPAAKNGEGFSNIVTGGDTMMVIFNFILIIGLLLASLISASKLGATGASGMINMGKKMQTWGQNKIKTGAGAATFGVGGRLGRKVIGGTAQLMAESERMQNWAAKGGAVSKLSLKTLRKVGDSSFDFRNTTIGKDLKIGAGIKGGYKTQQDKAKQAELTYAKSLKGESDILARNSQGNLITGKNGQPIKLSNSEAYAQRKLTPPTRNIWEVFKTPTGQPPTTAKEGAKNITGEIIRGAGIRTGQRQAVGAINTEVTKKRAWEEAKDKLNTDPDLINARKSLREARDTLKDIREIDQRKPTAVERQKVYSAEDKVKRLETKLKEAAEEAKENYTSAKDKTKV